VCGLVSSYSTASDLAQIATHAVECRTDLATQSGHRGNRRNRDKGGNETILDGGRAPIIAEEFDNLSHVSFPCVKRRYIIAPR